MQDDTNRKPTQGWLALECESDLGVYNLSTETPTQNMEMMERIVAPSNVREAYRRVKGNSGCPGVDGMTVEELSQYLRTHWQQVREELLEGTYEPSPVKRRLRCYLWKQWGRAGYRELRKRGVPLSRLYA